MNSTGSIITSMSPVALTEVEQVAMLRRIDTKFIIEENQLAQLLTYWIDDFDILEINNVRQLQYRTTYLDTPEFKCFRDHHNGKLNRYKIRFRDYLDSRMTFFEIKKKILGKETLKSRLKLPFNYRSLDNDITDLLKKENINHPVIEEKIVVSFSRISLIARTRRERITIDTNLVFNNSMQTIALPDIVVVELKQEKADFNTPAIKQIKALGIRPGNFSKYVTAVSLLEKTVKYNNLKPLHLKLQLLADAYTDND